MLGTVPHAVMVAASRAFRPLGAAGGSLDEVARVVSITVQPHAASGRMRLLTAALAVVLLVDLAVVALRSLERGPPPLEPGWTSLMSGDMPGWHHHGAGDVMADTIDGEAVYRTTGGPGVLWHDRAVSDFVLDLEFQVRSRDDDSGVFVRLPNPPRGDAYVRYTFEVQIHADGEGVGATGAIAGVQPPFQRVAITPGNWHRLRIQVQGPVIEVVLDDVVVNGFQMRPAGPVEGFATRGHLGLENHGPDDVVRFRRIRLRER